MNLENNLFIEIPRMVDSWEELLELKMGQNPLLPHAKLALEKGVEGVRAYLRGHGILFIYFYFYLFCLEHFVLFCINLIFSRKD